MEGLMKLSPAPDDSQFRFELYQVLLNTMAQAYFLQFQSTPENPDWAPVYNSVFTVQPNPDDAYMQAPIRGDLEYRIVGERGSVYLLTFGIGKGRWGTGMAPAPLMHYFDADKDLKIGADGHFEVILSPRERPQGHTGNWWKIDADAEFIILRQRSYDWGTERDARVAIEPLEWLPPKPRLTKEQIADRMAVMADYTDAFTRVWLEYHNDFRRRGIVNRFEFSNFGNQSGLKTGVQYYWQGLFDIQPGEALILDTEIPDPCRYWNLQTNDLLFNCVEFIQRQSSLNGHQARLDSDGRFRAVVALEDPGVPNWIDTAGHQQGVLMGRWYEFGSAPVPTLTKVPFADVRKHLPADTPTVTPKAREAILRKRRLGGQLRRRW
jgi:hypothetical protein